MDFKIMRLKCKIIRCVMYYLLHLQQLNPQQLLWLCWPELLSSAENKNHYWNFWRIVIVTTQSAFCTCRFNHSNNKVSSNRYNDLDHTTACSRLHNRTVSLLLWHVKMSPVQPDHYLTLQLCEDLLLIYDLCKQYTEYPCFERDICRRFHELKSVAV